MYKYLFLLLLVFNVFAKDSTPVDEVDKVKRLTEAEIKELLSSPLKLTPVSEGEFIVSQDHSLRLCREAYYNKNLRIFISEKSGVRREAYYRGCLTSLNKRYGVIFSPELAEESLAKKSINIEGITYEYEYGPKESARILKTFHFTWDDVRKESGRPTSVSLFPLEDQGVSIVVSAFPGRDASGCVFSEAKLLKAGKIIDHFDQNKVLNQQGEADVNWFLFDDTSKEGDALSYEIQLTGMAEKDQSPCSKTFGDYKGENIANKRNYPLELSKLENNTVFSFKRSVKELPLKKNFDVDCIECFNKAAHALRANVNSFRDLLAKLEEESRGEEIRFTLDETISAPVLYFSRDGKSLISAEQSFVKNEGVLLENNNFYFVKNISGSGPNALTLSRISLPKDIGLKDLIYSDFVSEETVFYEGGSGTEGRATIGHRKFPGIRIRKKVEIETGLPGELKIVASNPKSEDVAGERFVTIFTDASSGYTLKKFPDGKSLRITGNGHFLEFVEINDIPMLVGSSRVLKN